MQCVWDDKTRNWNFLFVFVVMANPNSICLSSKSEKRRKTSVGLFFLKKLFPSIYSAIFRVWFCCSFFLFFF